ncbi:MAG: hypothetical protein WC641_01865 [Patescibacteria group bacterium]
MLAFALIAFGSLFEEVTLSLNKIIMTRRLQTLSVLGFLQSLVTLVFYLIYGSLAPHGFVFSWSSWVTVSIRTVLEVFIAYCTMQAVAKAERSAYGFIRAFTVPLLLVVDVAFGYRLGLLQQIGILVTFVSVAVLTMNHGFSKKGIGWVIATALTAVLTVSLYKYDLNFNSVASEQSIMYAASTIFFFALIMRTKEDVFGLLKTKGVPWAILSACFGSLLQGLSYQYAAGSWIIAMKRACGVLLAVLSGRVAFKEEKLGLKLAAFAGCLTGFLLMVLG